MAQVGTWLELLFQWAKAGKAVADHILSCTQCLEADRREAQHQPSQYCSIGNELWAEEMRCEAEVIRILPELPEEVRNEARGFKFKTGHEA